EGAGIALSVAIGDPAIGAVGLIGASARSLRTVLRRGAAERARTGVDRQHPGVAALDRASEELLERAIRREPSMGLAIGEQTVTLRLAGWEQAIHMPPLALATMLHRETVLLHGADDAWSDPAESELLAAVLAEAGNAPERSVAAGGHELVEAADDVISAFADALHLRMQPRDLPPVLLAIEEMGGSG